MASAIGGIVGGVGQIAGSLAGRNARKREAASALAEQQQAKDAFDSFEMRNEFAGAENVMEDATINQQASNFQAQQTDAALAQGLDAIVAGGGGGGGAQAIAAAALQSKQGISANIAGQESANMQARLQNQAKLDFQERQGADDMQLRNFDQTQMQLNTANARKIASDAAQAEGTKMLTSGIGSLAGGVAGAFGGAFGGAKDTGGKIGTGDFKVDSYETFMKK
jgi:hypothetical protein|tara:strand:+ start:793 stop:1461 length:669 start_codon:yes stop_codon:yes gene_type:complete